jgi:hypothetical protein
MSGKELRRAGILARVESGELKLVNAAVMMGVSYRQSKRLGQRYREEGAEGLKQRSVGRESNRKKAKKFREPQASVLLTIGLWLRNQHYRYSTPDGSRTPELRRLKGEDLCADSPFRSRNGAAWSYRR